MTSGRARVASDSALTAAGPIATVGLSSKPASSGVRADKPPAPGSESARISPAPALGPEPPANGWWDSGLAPNKPICVPSPWSSPEPVPPGWPNSDVTCAGCGIERPIPEVWVSVCRIASLAGRATLRAIVATRSARWPGPRHQDWS